MKRSRCTSAETSTTSLHERQDAIATRLPPEILLRIIAFCRDPIAKFSTSNWDRARVTKDDTFDEEPPWVYSHVCRIWRDALCACPRFWTHYRLSNDNGEYQPANSRNMYKRDVNRWDTQQQRANGLPLQLSVELQQEAPHPIQDAMFNNTSRWSQVQISISEARIVKQLQRNQDLGTFSNLTYLHFTFTLSVWDRRTKWPQIKFQTFAQALSLRTLATTMAVVDHFEFPWQVLEHLIISNVDKPEPMRQIFLSASDKLQTLTFGCTKWQTQPGVYSLGQTVQFDWEEPIAMPKLQELSLEGLAVTSDIFESISTPVLRRLTCLRGIGDSFFHSRAFTTALTDASWCGQLTHLRIDQFPTVPFPPFDTFRDIVSETPALADLQLSFEHTPRIANGWAPGDNMLDLLCVREGERLVCPRLEKMDLLYVAFEPKTLLRLLSSRLRTSSNISTSASGYTPSLQRFVICFPDGCAAAAQYAWSTQQRSELEELVGYLKEYNIYVPHADEDEYHLDVGNVERETASREDSADSEPSDDEDSSESSDSE